MTNEFGGAGEPLLAPDSRFDGLLGHVDHLDLLVEDVLGDALRGIAAVGWSGGHRLGGGGGGGGGAGGVLPLSATAPDWVFFSSV